MANGLGSAFSPGFRERNRSALSSIESGPSLGEVRAQGEARGLTGGNVSAESGSSGLGISDVAGVALSPLRLVGDVLSAASTGRTLSQNRELQQAEQERMELARQQMQAQIRQQNLASAAQAIGIASEFSQQLSQIDDPEQRAAVRRTLEPQLEEFGLTPLFRSMVENDHLAFIDRKEQLSRAIKYSPTAQRWVGLNNADPSAAPAEVQQQMLQEWGTGEARDYIAKGRPIAKRLIRRFEQDNPQRAEQLRESDGAITTDEFAEIVSTYQSSEPDISDPGVRSNLLASVRRFPESYGLKPQSDVQRRRELVEKESVKAEFRQPPRADAVNVLLPSGERRLGRETADGQLLVAEPNGRMVPAPSGAQIIGTTITGTAEEVLPQTKKSAQSALDASAKIADATRLLERLNSSGAGVTGVRGFLTENVAGAISQVNESLGEMTAQLISGASLRELQTFQTEARAMVAQSVEQLTGEESGRITDKELQLAERASALVQTGKGFQQTLAGLTTLQKLSVVSQDRSIIEAGGTPTPLDTDEQKKEELNRLITQLGMSPADAADTVRSMMKMREQLDIAIRGIQGGDGGRAER